MQGRGRHDSPPSQGQRADSDRRYGRGTSHIGSLSRTNAVGLLLTQSIQQALDRLDLPLRVRVKCLRRLSRACGCHGLLPKALMIPVCYDHTAYPLYRGGYADVWKGGHRDREVAVKVIRVYSKNNLEKVVGVGYLSIQFRVCEH